MHTRCGPNPDCLMPRHRSALLPMRALTLALLATLALSACRGGDEPAPADPAADSTPLPGPTRTGGAVTSMPDAPGPGEVPLAGSPPAAATRPGAGVDGLPPLHENPEAGLSGPQPVPVGGARAADVAADGQAAAAPVAIVMPVPDMAAAVGDPRDALRAYYAAVNARDFGAAQALWDGTRPAAQLAADYADAASVELTVGAPRAPEGAAGSVYVEVPVTVTTRRNDGSVRRQAGRYTLRRAQVDGATPAQRAWHITAVDLRDAAG